MRPQERPVTMRQRQLQAKEGQQQPGAGRGTEDGFPRAFGQSVGLLVPDFWLPELWENKSLLLWAPSLWEFATAVTGHSYTCRHSGSDRTQEWRVWKSEGLCSDVGQIHPGARSSHQQGPGGLGRGAALGIKHKAAPLGLLPQLPPTAVRTCDFPLQLPFPQLWTRGFGLGRGFSQHRPRTTSSRSTWGHCSRCRFLAPPRPFESEQNGQWSVRKSGCPGSWGNGIWHPPHRACPADASGHGRASSLAHCHGEAA